jgi:hypothetical protein
MNKTPHIVGGGLGSLRKQAKERWEAQQKEQQKAANSAALARLVQSVKK